MGDEAVVSSDIFPRKFELNAATILRKFNDIGRRGAISRKIGAYCIIIAIINRASGSSTSHGRIWSPLLPPSAPYSLQGHQIPHLRVLFPSVAMLSWSPASTALLGVSDRILLGYVADPDAQIARKRVQSNACEE
jgi:hypothetical protein